MRLRQPISQYIRQAAQLRVLAHALIACGLVLVIYVSAEYVGVFYDQRQLEREWAEQERAPVENSSSRSIANAPSDRLTRILIPKINLDAVVVEGTNNRDLMKGPGHIRNTAYPGQAGNSVISAHRDTFFRNIYELQKGDVIEVRRNGQAYRYEVMSKKIVDPDDVSVIRPSKDARLTLITCYPTYFIGPAPERLVVFSKLIDHAPDTGRASALPTSQLATPVNASPGASH